MYRAHVHLHPHTPAHAKSSTLPGTFPVTTVSHEQKTTEMSRELILTAEKPTAPIGRSSKNKLKCLFAAKDNAFFDSPVMSRSHAEISLILDPPMHKVIIKDTSSMHGTFVNGLQLRESEEAELRDGTELTFGADVTKGQEVHPAKTFRCMVSWEQEERSNNNEATKKRSGYGVSGEDLIISEEESFSDDYNEDEDDEEYSLHSDGFEEEKSSPPTSPLEFKISKFDKAIDDLYSKPAQPDSKPPPKVDVICIDDDVSARPAPQRQCMPSIPSLVNRSRGSEEIEVIIVDDTPNTSSDADKAVRQDQAGDSEHPVVIDEDEEEEAGVRDSVNLLVAAYDEDETDSEASESEEEEEDDDDDEEQSDGDDDQEAEDEDESMHDDEEESVSNKNPEEESHRKLKDEPALQSNTENSAEKSIYCSEPDSRPRFANILWPESQSTDQHRAPPNAHNASYWQSETSFSALGNDTPSQQKPSNIRNSLPSINPYTPVSVQQSTPVNWYSPRVSINQPSNVAPETDRPLPAVVPPSWMESKKDFFEARADNMARAIAGAPEVNAASDDVRSWGRYRPASWLQNTGLTSDDGFVGRSGGIYTLSMVRDEPNEKAQETISHDENEMDAEDIPQVEENSSINSQVDGSFIKNSLSDRIPAQQETTKNKAPFAYEEHSFDDDVMDVSPSNADQEQASGSEEKFASTPATKNWIKDVMNVDVQSHQPAGAELTPVPESATFSNFFASPPPSEQDDVQPQSPVVEVEKVVPEAPEADNSSKKRKFERMTHVEIPLNGDEFEREAYEEVGQEGTPARPERKIKRARTKRRQVQGSTAGIAGYAAAMLGGIIVGGAGVFAALLATAE